ncbi:MAG: prepilin peptidase [Actinomycetota bacterium]
MTGYLIGLCAVLGVVVGSFLNVVIWRVPRGESVVRPPSHCPSCGESIAARDNIPVLSWLLLRGQCRHCHARISARYPAVEATTAVVFAALAWRIGGDWALLAYLYIGAIGVALTLIDIDVHRLPDPIVLPSYVVVPALLLLPAVIGGRWDEFLRAIFGGAALFAFFAITWLIYPPGIGRGDIKLMGVLGMALGWIGWGAVVVGLFAGFLLGGLPSAVLLMARKVKPKSRIPFGPFLIGGAAVGIFAGDQIFTAYLRAMGLS